MLKHFVCSSGCAVLCKSVAYSAVSYNSAMVARKRGSLRKSQINPTFLRKLLELVEFM
jgi:hypothetical protein